MCYHSPSNGSCAVRCGLGIFGLRLMFLLILKKTFTVNLIVTLNQLIMNIFQQITEYAKRQYSTFDMKNNWVGSINGFGSLNCIYQSIVLPSDTWKMGHNIMVKLPPLISPAFTRIKGIVNSFYTSYASVWNYWNSFISDRPEDAFLSRSVTSAYKGKFVEPCCGMSTIAFICKVARGYFDYLSGSAQFYSVTYGSSNTQDIKIGTVHRNLNSSLFSPTTITWSITSSGLRQVSLSSNVSSFDASGDFFGHDLSSAFTMSFQTPFSSNSERVSELSKLGFANASSYFIYQCQEVVRSLSNMGVPVDLIAETPIDYYSGERFNLLNFMCLSSVWQNFYRDEQNQSPEFDYREVNGDIVNRTLEPSSQFSTGIPYGWNLRLIGIPPNVSTGSDYWFKITTFEQAFSVLTGFLLEESVRSYLNQTANVVNVVILPKFYNGLLCLKYRNFEKDYFTSASVDPNMGGVQVQVPNTIDALRTASKLEEFLELSASARDFYNFMKHLWGTNPESTRYQKPLLLGTQVVPIQIGEQLQTSETTSSSPLGDRAGVADGYGNSGTANHYFNEHGFICSLLSFVLDSQYMQGMPHEFNHHVFLDYPVAHFANLGAESIPLKEIYYSNLNVSGGVDYLSGDNNAHVDDGQTASFIRNIVSEDHVVPVSGNGIAAITSENNQQSTGTSPSDVTTTTYLVDPNSGNPYTVAAVHDHYYFDQNNPAYASVFGYIPRYSRWKCKQDVVAGQMRDSLEFWHTFRHFSSRPFISNNFVSYMNAGFLSNLNRIFAVVNDNADKFVCDIFNNASVRRALPLVPQTIMD